MFASNQNVIYYLHKFSKTIFPFLGPGLYDTLSLFSVHT